jgi:hypothetical protein
MGTTGEIMTEAICRGGYFLGTSCNRCERCRQERETLRRAFAVSQAALAIYDNHRKPYPADESPLFDKLWIACKEMRAWLLAGASGGYR